MSNFITWMGNLPTSWQARPLKAVAIYSVSNVDKVSNDDETPVLLCNYTDVYKNEFINLEIPFMEGTATIDEISKFGLLVGDIVITKDSESWDDIAIPALIVESSSNLVCGYHLAVIRPKPDKIFSHYLFRCLQSKQLRIQLELASTGVTRYGLPKGAIGNMLLPIPDLPTQRRIAAYLDQETARIDALIAAKERLLTLLAEKRQALITRAVTLGLDPDVKLKDSGIGELPEGWVFTRVKYVTSKIGSGVTPKGGAEVYLNEGIPFLRSQNIHFDGIKTEDMVFISDEMHNEMSGSVVKKGDVLLNITGASIGRCYFFEDQFQEANVNQHVCILRPNHKNVLTKYLYYFLASELGQSQVEQYQTGGGREGLNFESLKSFIIPVPSLKEQVWLIDKLDDEINKIKLLHEDAERSIVLLKERRAALISACVTGQLEIKNHES